MSEQIKKNLRESIASVSKGKLEGLPENAKDIPSGLTIERSSIGLKLSAGVIFEESKVDLRWPNSLRTYREMMYDATLSSVATAFKSIIGAMEYRVVIEDHLENISDEQKLQIDFIKSCMHDMDQSWSDFMKETCSKLIYGFAVHEKVFKYRKGDKGKYKSRFKDGKLGWAKLAPRSQDTITKWEFDSHNRELKYVYQNLSLDANAGLPRDLFSTGEVKLPANKILNFTHDSTRGNPQGRSPLNACYVSWRYKINIEELEALMVSRDLNGLPVFKMPVEFLSKDADADKKAVYNWAIDTINNLHSGESAGIVMPSFIDPETKQDIFGFELKSSQSTGASNYDTDKMISRYENKILMTFLADILKMGQNSVGSYALSDNKSSLFQAGINNIVQETLEVINKELIPQTLRVNGWDISEKEIPKIIHVNSEEFDLDDLSKFIQRTVAVGSLEVDENLSDELRKIAGLPTADRNRPIKPEMTGKGSSRSGDGMQTDGEGTSTNTDGGDASTSNTEHA